LIFDVPTEVGGVVERIAQACSPRAVVLFGSYAKGTQNPRSDIDLLVIAETGEPQGLRPLRLRALLARSPIQVDAIVYTSDEVEDELRRPYSFVRSILGVGLLVYGSDDWLKRPRGHFSPRERDARKHHTHREHAL
jgi:predicted nucleotidyltransferase